MKHYNEILHNGIFTIMRICFSVCKVATNHPNYGLEIEQLWKYNQCFDVPQDQCVFVSKERWPGMDTLGQSSGDVCISECNSMRTRSLVNTVDQKRWIISRIYHFRQR